MSPRRLTRLGFTLFTACILCSCDSRQDRSAPALPAPLAETQAVPVEADGAKFQALAYANPQQAAQVFGFDIRGAGLLPVRVNIGNQGSSTLKIMPAQTFLIDADGQAWPLLTASQAFDRLGQANAMAFGPPRKPAPDSLDALTGFALDMATGAGFSANAEATPERHSGQSLSAKDLRNPKILAGQAASGVLFFPGQDEAKGLRALRLCYSLDGGGRCLSVPLPVPPPPVAVQ